MSLPRQITTFFGVGLVSTMADYGTLVLLREVFLVNPVYGSLVGYIVGGVVNYLLNRAHTFSTARDHVEAGWRFASVMVVGFTLTGIFMHVFAEKMGLNEMLSRMITTGIVFFWNFIAHKTWTFAETRG